MRSRGSGRAEFAAGPAWATAIGGVALLLLGQAAVGPPLTVCGIALILLSVVCLIWVPCVARLTRVEARIDTDAVTEGDLLNLEVRVTRRGVARLASIRLDHTLLAEPMTVPPTTGHTQPVTIACRAGGIGVVEPRLPSLSVSDPLGLCSLRRAGAPLGRELLVLPRPQPVRFLAADRLGDGQSGLRGGLSTEALDLAGLRDYVPGTPATRIHWPALARGGTLLERVYESPSGARPALAVDLRCRDPDGASVAADAVRRAVASLAVALATQGGVEVWLPGRPTPLVLGPSLAAWPALGRALARSGAAPLHAPPPRLAPHGAPLVLACIDPSRAIGLLARRAGPVFALSFAGGHWADGAAVLETAGCIAAAVTVPHA